MLIFVWLAKREGPIESGTTINLEQLHGQSVSNGMARAQKGVNSLASTRHANWSNVVGLVRTVRHCHDWPTKTMTDQQQ